MLHALTMFSSAAGENALTRGQLPRIIDKAFQDLVPLIRIRKRKMSIMLCSFIFTKSSEPEATKLHI